MDLGNGFDFWNTIPMRFRSSITSTSGLWMSCPPTLMEPVMRTESMRSFIRLKQRRNVDLPQPEGPMKAVTRRSPMVSVMSFNACAGP